MPKHHAVPATPETMVWGTLDARIPPVLTVESGDTVELACVPAGSLASLPPDRSRVPAEFLTAIERIRQGPGAHFVTGPVAVRGANRGDVLQVEILEARVTMDWGFTLVSPLLGTLPGEFPEAEHIHPDIDLARQTCRLPWGTEIPLDPFFGVMGTAPPAEWGACSTNIPRAFGGNMDNKELKPGTTLYLPVFAEGALFYAGDGHGVQGDGEVCISALETALTGRFRLTLRKDLSLDVPFAETATHLISIGIDEDLDDAAKQAVREMVREICARTNLSRNHAYMLCSLVGDLRVTQTVDGNKGCHMMLPKKFL